MMDKYKEMMKQTLERLEKLEKPCYLFDLSEERADVFQSKVGGFPYLARGESLPCSGDNKKPFNLVAQFSIGDLKDKFPAFPLEEGLLQFWLSEQTLNVVEVGHYLKQGEDSLVLYFPKLEDAYTEQELVERYPYLLREEETESDTLLTVENAIPITNPVGYSLEWNETTCPISPDVFQFDAEFVAVWNELFPEDGISSWEDIELSYEELYHCFEQQHKRGHKLLGYPDLLEEDFRGKTEEFKEYILLFQLESDFLEEESSLRVSWGDSCGTGYWFIHPDDLRSGDFTKVLFYWEH